MDIRRTGASVCIRIAIAGLARPRARGGPEDSPAAGSSLGIADVRAVPQPAVPVAVEPASRFPCFIRDLDVPMVQATGLHTFGYVIGQIPQADQAVGFDSFAPKPCTR